MASQVTDQAASSSPASIEPLVQIPATIAPSASPLNWKRLIPAGVFSAIVHSMLLFAFVAFSVPTAAVQVGTEQTVIETQVEDERPQANLENTDTGDDPDQPAHYDTPRVDSVVVPGPVNPDEAVGILHGADAPPMNLPPPPGFSTNRGQGGGQDASSIGKGRLEGFAGAGVGLKPLRAGSFDGRSSATDREQLVKEGGGNAQSEAAVANGLKWLANHQSPDGHWSLDHFSVYGKCNCGGAGMKYDVAGTALGLLPLLGAGQTHKPVAGKPSLYAKNVERALKWLILRQNGQGDFASGENMPMYSHGLATIAICEAYGLTSDPALQKTAQRAINFIVKAQSDSGGWRYVPRQNGDTSVVGWQVMALKSGQMAGLDVPAKSLTMAGKWLDSCATPDGSGYGYTDATPTSTMTAVGLLCRQYQGWGPRNPSMQAGVKRLRALPPDQAPSLYYTYYATQVMHHMGGDAWDFWNPRVRDLLIARQDRGTTPGRAHQKGSWDPRSDAHGGPGGRLMVTSLALLTLEVYYRHLPLYRRDELISGTR